MAAKGDDLEGFMRELISRVCSYKCRLAWQAAEGKRIASEDRAFPGEVGGGGSHIHDLGDISQR